MATGRFIVLDGIDGSGTTTQSKLVAEWLRGKGLEVVETCEPTRGAVGRVIRQALSRALPGREGAEVEPELFALLFAADRLDHMNATVVPALERGQWVVSDRCYLSSFAYQSTGCDLDWVRTLNQHARRADLIILLDMDARAAYDRFATTRPNREVFETVERMTAIRANYLTIAEVLGREGDRIVRLDASPPAEKVAEEVSAAVSEFL